MNGLLHIKSDIKKESLSHAYLFLGNDSQAINDALEAIREGLNVVQDDITEVFGGEGSGKSAEIDIESIRSLIHEINLSTVGTTRLAIIHDCERLNQSSANILLKTLEEPPNNVILVLISAKDDVLSTIKSRCRVIKFYSKSAISANAYDIGFLHSDFGTISRQIELIVKQNEIDMFLDKVEEVLRQKLYETKSENATSALKNLYVSKRYLRQNGNARLVLENLALDVRNII